MEKIAIIGAGGFGREVKMIVDAINQKLPTYDFIGFFDDNASKGELVNGYPVLGSIDDLNTFDESLSIALGVGDPITKKNIVGRLKNNKITFPKLIHPNAIIGQDDVVIEEGTIICAGSIITCNIKIKKFVTLNLMCTVGHDTIINDFSSFMPAVNISGEVIICQNVYVGTGVKIINQLEIGKNTIIGAGAVVSKSLPENCTAVGIPAKPIKFHNKNEQ